jgi:hypothetical protein
MNDERKKNSGVVGFVLVLNHALPKNSEYLVP